MRTGKLFVLAVAAILAARAAVQGQPKPRTFLVPARAKTYDAKATVEGNDVTVWVKRGGAVKAQVNCGLFFVEAGGALQVDGNVLRIVVAEGGALAAVDGNVVHVHHAKGARIGPIRASVDHVTVHDAVTIRQTSPFMLTGTVRGADGKPAAGVKVHAHTLGEEHLTSQTTDAGGAFVFSTDEEISSLSADLSANWSDKKRVGANVELGLRRRLSLLQGWETVLAHGPWLEKAEVDLAHQGQAKLMLQEMRVLETGKQGHPAFRLSRDGAFLAVLAQEDGFEKKAETQLWDIRSGKQLGRFPLKPQTTGELAVVFSPDSKVLALIGPNSRIHLHRLPGGEELPELEAQEGWLDCLAFSGDGNLLAAGGKFEIRTWDLRSGRRQRFKGHADGATCLAFSPDGKTLVSGGYMRVQDGMVNIQTADKLRRWDLASGDEIDQPPGQEGALAFSSDGLLLSAGEADKIVRNGNSISFQREETIILANPSAGRELLRLGGKGRIAVFSADEHLIVSVGRDAMIHFTEALTGQAVLAVPIPEHWAPSVALTSDGRLLATGREGGAIVFWDLRWDRLRVPQELPAFTDAGKERLWQSLAGDAAQAYEIVWQLTSAPAPALQFLRERLPPIPPQDLPIKKWLQDLESQQFAVREAASRELRRHGRIVEAALRAGLESKSLEVRRRIEAILSEVQRQVVTPEELRQVRSVAALEWMASNEARQVLTTLADGWSAARQTQEAAAALRRLGR